MRAGGLRSSSGNAGADHTQPSFARASRELPRSHVTYWASGGGPRLAIFPLMKYRYTIGQPRRQGMEPGFQLVLQRALAGFGYSPIEGAIENGRGAGLMKYAIAPVENDGRQCRI